MTSGLYILTSLSTFSHSKKKSIWKSLVDLTHCSKLTKDHLIFQFYNRHVPVEYFRPHKTWHFIIYGEYEFILFNCAKL